MRMVVGGGTSSVTPTRTRRPTTPAPDDPVLLEPARRPARDVVGSVAAQRVPRGYRDRDRRGGGRLVHGVAAPELRRAHARSRRFPGCRRGGLAGRRSRRRVLHVVHRGGAGHRAPAGGGTTRIPRG